MVIAATEITAFHIAGGLLALWAVVLAVLAYGTVVPHLYEALDPTVCPPGVSGMDCLPASYGAEWFATAGAIVVLLGRLASRAA